MTQAMSCLAVIPAWSGLCTQTGSWDGRWMHPVAGQPMLAWLLEEAQLISSVQRTLVLTDDPAVMAVCQQHGVEVLDDEPWPGSGEPNALLQAMGRAVSGLGERPNIVVGIDPSYPLIESQDIDAAVTLIEQGLADLVIPVVDAPTSHWGGTANIAGASQTMSPAFRVWKTEQLLNPQTFDGGRVKHQRIGMCCGHGVFEPIQASLAEVVLRDRLKQRHISRLPNPLHAVISDFDGVWTDNRVIVNQDGIESTVCSRGDGMGLGMLKKAGVPILVMSKERNPVVTTRCNKLDIECMQAIDDKKPALLHWLSERGFDPAHCIYLGNDVNDAQCLETVGCGIVVADAHPDVMPLASIVLEHPGGYGAVREVCDMVLEHLRQV